MKIYDYKNLLLEEIIDMPENNIEKKAISSPKKLKVIERTCTGCGSIISSKILKQCPICDTVLEELAITIPEKKEGQESLLVFTGKKLELADKYVIKKGQWNFKEAISVFFNSLVLYIFVELIIVGLFYLALTPDPTQNPLQLTPTIELMTIAQIPGVFLIIYPLVYINMKKHKLSKLGFNSVKKSLTIAIIIGVGGGLLVYLTSLLAMQLNNSLISSGLELFRLPTYISEESQILRESQLIYKVVILVLLLLDALGKEITFRGVFHNGLAAKFQSQIVDKIYVILIVSTVYSVLFLFLTFNVGFVIESFLVNIVLGIIYESTNRNLYASIIANSLYVTISFIWILTIF